MSGAESVSPVRRTHTYESLSLDGARPVTGSFRPDRANMAVNVTRPPPSSAKSSSVSTRVDSI